MSTNFDMWHRGYQAYRHLGQRAGGWRFLFRAWPAAGIVGIQSWLRQLDDAEWIADEYGQHYSVDEFLEAVEACEGGQPRGLYGNDWRDGSYTFCASEFC